MHKTVPVTLLRVAVPLTAAPGDHLMILGDICVGVDTARPEKATRVRLSPADAPAARSKAAKRSKPTQGRKLTPKGMVSREQVLHCFKSPDTALTGGAVSRLLGLSAGSALPYYYLSQLVRDKVLKLTREPNASGHGRRINTYQLRVTNTATKGGKRARPRADLLAGLETEPTIEVTPELLLAQFTGNNEVTKPALYGALGLRGPDRKKAGFLLERLVAKGELTVRKDPSNANSPRSVFYQLAERSANLQA